MEKDNRGEVMRDYWIFEHDSAVYEEHLSKGFWHYFDMIGGPMNIIDVVAGELFLLTDSRGKRRKRKRGAGRVRFILPRTAVYTDGINQNDITRLLAKYGIRTRRKMYDHMNTYFTVRGSQSDWAITVLDRWKAGQLGASWAEKRQERKQAQPGLFQRLLGI